MVDHIIPAAEGWKNQLQTCQYAGEVVVPESEMDDLATLIRRYKDSTFEDQVGICLLILAVNCMYYDFDESGFWFHFLGRLNLSEAPSNRDRLGRIIEDRLDDFGLLREVREGPWRYVNALKEQCGITRKEIPHYADILRFFYDRYGWEGLRTIDLAAFRRSISQCCPSGHLSIFLSDRFGWEFTRSVSRTLHQLEHSYLDSGDLSSIKGYHPSFFPDLQRYLTTEPTHASSQSAGLLAIPRLVFIPDFMQLALLFPQNGINQRAYEFEGEVISSTPLFLQKEEDFRSIYKGRKRDEGASWSRWLISGWEPRSAPIALFDVETGWNDRRNVDPGSYYLLAPADREIPDPIITAQFGPVDLPHEDLYYIAYQIEIEEDTSLDFIGISSRVSPTRTFLSWSSHDTQLDGACDIGSVFSGSLPPVHVDNASLFASNDLALFLYNGIEVSRVEVAETSDTCEILLDLPIPCAGKLWVEPISRLRDFAGQDRLDELNFILLPHSRIGWPDRLLHQEEEVRIEFEGDDSLVLELDGCEKEEGVIQDVWRVEPGTTLVEGTLHCGDFPVNVARRLFRASLRKRDCPQLRLLTEEDFRHRTDLVVNALPGSPASIYLSDNGCYELGSVESLNPAGIGTFSSIDLRDAVLGVRSVLGEFLVQAGGALTGTQTFFLNMETLRVRLSSHGGDLELAFPEGMPEDMRELFDLLDLIRSGRQTRLSLPSYLPEIPTDFFQFIKHLVICSAIFDGVLIQGMADHRPEHLLAQVEEERLACLLSWFVKARAFSEGGLSSEIVSSRSLLEQYSAESSVFLLPRWQEQIDQILVFLDEDRKFLPLLEEWAQDAKGSLRTSYGSRLSRQNQGKELTEAWIYYRMGNTRSSYETALYILGTASSPIRELAFILVKIVLMRKALLVSQPDLSCESSHPYLGPCCAFFDGLSKALVGDAPSTVAYPTEMKALLERLPLREEDRRLCLLFLCPGEAAQFQVSEDWLSLYLKGLECEPNGQSTAEVGGQLRAIIHTIPESPERSDIVSRLERWID